MIDPDGHVARKTYSGIVGFGIQIVLSASIGCYQGFVGAEALWFAFTGNNNFGNGLMPWIYFFAGGSMGLTLNFSKLLSPNLLHNPKNVLKGFGFSFSCSIGVIFFLITANKMTSPDDYTRSFYFWTGTVWGVTVSKASGGKISTYGVGITWEIGISKCSFSFGQKLFGISGGGSYYWPIALNSNAKALYSIVRGRV